MEILADDNPTAAEVLMTVDDEQTEAITDSSRRRIQVLVAIIRNLIFKHHNETITEANIRDLLSDVTDVEIRTCLLICNRIMPYVPSKENWFTLAYQLPFILMANSILRISGYSKFSINISPLTMPSKLNALFIDAPSLFSLFCSRKIKNTDVRLDIYDFSNQKIVSKEVATENKDAVFSSFFDIERIKTEAKSYGQYFAHSMTFLPGLKTVRVSGILRNNNTSYTSNIQANDDGFRTNQEIKPAIEEDQSFVIEDIKTLDRKYKELCKERNEALLDNRLYKLKKEWKDGGSKEKLYTEIKKEKQRRREVNNMIAEVRYNLQKRRRELYLAKHHYKKESNSKTKFEISRTNKFCLRKATDVVFNDNFLFSHDTHFGGTDNGLVNMTETCKFNLKRFQNHIKLYNYYSTLKTDGMYLFITYLCHV